MKKVTLDPSKVTYDGTSFVVTYSDDSLLAKFKLLKESFKTK